MTFLGLNWIEWIELILAAAAFICICGAIGKLVADIQNQRDDRR